MDRAEVIDNTEVMDNMELVSVKFVLKHNIPGRLRVVLSGDYELAPQALEVIGSAISSIEGVSKVSLNSTCNSFTIYYNQALTREERILAYLNTMELKTLPVQLETIEPGKVKRKSNIFLTAVGTVLVGLGAAGIFLPVLPGVPILILAAYFISRHSDKLHKNLTESRFVTKYVTDKR